MRTTFSELQQLFKLDDDRQIRRGLVNKIEVVDSSHVRIKDSRLKEIMKQFRESTVLDMKEVCSQYKIPQSHLMYMIRDRMIPYFKLADAKGSKYLFLKSDLDKENRIFLFYSKKSRRDTFVEIGDGILTFLHDEGSVTTREHAIYKMYYLDLLTIEEIAGLQQLKVSKVQEIIRRSHYRLFRWLVRGLAHYNKQKTFEQMYYEQVRENGNLKKQIESLMPKEEPPPQPSPEILSTRIYDLDFSVRALNVLRCLDITTVRELVNYPKEKLLETRNAGTKTMKDIEKVLKDLGIKY
jgi:predicted DNA-binding protein YlxM (UPF0122 family)